MHFKCFSLWPHYVQNELKKIWIELGEFNVCVGHGYKTLYIKNLLPFYQHNFLLLFPHVKKAASFFFIPLNICCCLKAKHINFMKVEAFILTQRYNFKIAFHILLMLRVLFNGIITHHHRNACLSHERNERNCKAIHSI